MLRRLLLIAVTLVVAQVCLASNLTGLSVSPDAVAGGVQSVGTITLDTPVAGAPASIALTSSAGFVVVPATATVSVGQTTVTFPIITQTVTAQNLVTITASLNTVTKAATLTVNPVYLSTVTTSLPAVLTGEKATGTVTLTGPAPVGGIKVALTCNFREVGIPSSVQFAAGQSMVTFPITTKYTANPLPSTITATLGYVEAIAPFTVNPIGPSSVTLNPAAVNAKVPSVGTVTLYGPAPAGGLVIDLSANDKVVSLPRSVKIEAGQTTATFPIKTYDVYATVPVSIQAHFAGVSKVASLNVLAPTIATMTFNPNSILGGNRSVGTITLSYEAPPRGMTIQVSNDNPYVTIPATVDVRGGKKTVEFPVITTPISVTKPANIKALLNGAGPTVPVPITAPTLVSFEVSLEAPKPEIPPKTPPSEPKPIVPAGTAVTPPTPTPPKVVPPLAVATPKPFYARIMISGKASSDGLPFTVTSNVPSLVLPKKIGFPVGKNSIVFLIETQKVKASTPATITVTLNGATITASVVLN